MQSPSRLRRACEPCRRKKSKCPGEKPQCSTCQRLHQRCTYAKSQEGMRIQKSSQVEQAREQPELQENVRRLEARMESMADTLNAFIRQSEQRSPSSPNMFHSPAETRDIVDLSTDRFDILQSRKPSDELLQSLVEIYIEKINNQPLFIFDSDKLSSQVTQFSTMLRYSFLALTVRFSDDNFYAGVRSQAVEFYKSSVYRMLFPQALYPTVSVDTLASLCLLAACEIEDGMMNKAFMVIGIAARIVNCTNLLSTARTSDKSDGLLRCAWSLFLLDKLHGSSFRTLLAFPNDISISDVPISSANQTSTPSGFQTVTQTTEREYITTDPRDNGINVYCIRLMAIWGDLMIYLRKLKQGHFEEPWNADSIYQNIASQMFKLEACLPDIHRLKHARFDEVSSSTLIEHREYWAPWIFFQLTYHSIRGIMNHPFLHLANKNQRRKVRSASFLQHTIDQAITHSSWVSRFLEMCTEKAFQIFDPFVGHLAAVAATVHLFLRFSRETEISSRAEENYILCQNFLHDMANQHLHLQQTSAKLTKLAEAFSINENLQNNSSTPKVDSSLIWDLLDYAASSSPIVNSRNSSTGVELNVETQFLYPLTSNTPRATDSSSNQLNQEQEDLMTNFWNENAFEFDPLDLPDINDMSLLGMTKGLW